MDEIERERQLARVQDQFLEMYHAWRQVARLAPKEEFLYSVRWLIAPYLNQPEFCHFLEIFLNSSF
jgi:hypothetical protein